MTNSRLYLILNKDIGKDILIEASSGYYYVLLNFFNKNDCYNIKKLVKQGLDQLKIWDNKITIYIGIEMPLEIVNIIFQEIRSNIDNYTIHWQNKDHLNYVETQSKWINIYKDIVNNRNKSTTSYYEFIKKILPNAFIENTKYFPLTNAVGQGSKYPVIPVIIKPDIIDPSKRNLCIIGKSVIFDTGGINLKNHMIELMYADMAGSALIANIIGFMKEINKTSKYNIYCVFPIVENMIGPDSIRPSSIVSSYNGIQVEIRNTDAEGRLCLADGIEWAYNNIENPLIMTIATLTGNTFSISNGNSIIGYGNVDGLIKIGNQIGQPVDKLNVYLEMIEQTKSGNIIKNSSNSPNESAMATAFLMNFIKGEYIHLDIASVVVKNNKVTEFGFELLSKFLF